MNSTIIRSIGWLCFASDRMHAAELSQLRRLLSSDDSVRQRGVAMLIIVSNSTTQTHMSDVDTKVRSNTCRSPSLMSTSVGVHHPWWRRFHESSRNFTLTGTNFMSVSSHFARIKSSRSQYLSSTKHLSSGFYHNFLLNVCFKSLRVQLYLPLIGSTAVTSHAAVTSDARSIQISSQNIRIRC